MAAHGLLRVEEMTCNTEEGFRDAATRNESERRTCDCFYCFADERKESHGLALLLLREFRPQDRECHRVRLPAFLSLLGSPFDCCHPRQVTAHAFRDVFERDGPCGLFCDQGCNLPLQGIKPGLIGPQKGSQEL
jgi:hypothetical protein